MDEHDVTGDFVRWGGAYMLPLVSLVASHMRKNCFRHLAYPINICI